MFDPTRLESIVRAAGRMAIARWPGAGFAVESWEKSPGNPVCAADLEVDAFLKQELGALLPGSGWLSEETADDTARLEREFVWLVDPIDGTRDFLKGRAGWGVSVALVEQGRPVAGLLCAPAREEMWSAYAGRGATRNGGAIRASQRHQMPGARIPLLDAAAPFLDLERVNRPNAIALRVAMVAADEADVVSSVRWGHEWDIAAASLIAEEAGARVTDVHGASLSFNKHDPRSFGIIACAPPLHGETQERLARYMEERAATSRDGSS